MKVLLVTPEAVPFAKTGGLADVAGTLPIALKSLSLDVRVILPFYKMALQSRPKLKLVIDTLRVPVGSKIYSGEVWQSSLDLSTIVYLIKCNEFFDREQLYGTSRGDYPDNAERFIFFSRASLEFCLKIGFTPDIIHCHDWHTALIPYLIKKGDSKIKWKNFWNAKLTAADVVFCYLYPDVMKRLSDKLRSDLKPGTVVASCNFALPGFQSQRVLRPGGDLHNDPLYIYQM